jgi:hypothetical protein
MLYNNGCLMNGSKMSHCVKRIKCTRKIKPAEEKKKPEGKPEEKKKPVLPPPRTRARPASPPASPHLIAPLASRVAAPSPPPSPTLSSSSSSPALFELPQLRREKSPRQNAETKKERNRRHAAKSRKRKKDAIAGLEHEILKFAPNFVFHRPEITSSNVGITRKERNRNSAAMFRQKMEDYKDLLQQNVDRLRATHVRYPLRSFDLIEPETGRHIPSLALATHTSTLHPPIIESFRPGSTAWVNDLDQGRAKVKVVSIPEGRPNIRHIHFVGFNERYDKDVPVEFLHSS